MLAADKQELLLLTSLQVPCCVSCLPECMPVIAPPGQLVPGSPGAAAAAVVVAGHTADLLRCRMPLGGLDTLHTPTQQAGGWLVLLLLSRAIATVHRLD